MVEEPAEVRQGAPMTKDQKQMPCPVCGCKPHPFVRCPTCAKPLHPKTNALTLWRCETFACPFYTSERLFNPRQQQVRQ